MSVIYLNSYMLIILILLNINFKNSIIIFLPKILLINNINKQITIFIYKKFFYLKNIKNFYFKYKYTKANLSFNRLPYKCFVLH